MREITLRIRHHGAPESDASARHPAVTLRSVSSMTGSAAKRKRIVELSGPADSIAAFLEDFRASEPVVAAEALSPLDSSRVFAAITYDAYQWDSISQRLTDHGVHYRTGTTITAGWEHWTLYLEKGEDLGAIVESLEAAGNETELVRDVALDTVEGRQQLELSRVLYDELTPRQREVLGAAIELGYYQPRREAGVEEIAAQVGIATTTAWEHLARAEAKVMAEIGDHLSSERR
jgi:predicted DNA binding protein